MSERVLSVLSFELDTETGELLYTEYSLTTRIAFQKTGIIFPITDTIINLLLDEGWTYFDYKYLSLSLT